MAGIGTPGAPFVVAVGPAGVAGNGRPTQELTSFTKVQLRSNFTDGDQLTFDALGDSPEAAQLDELATDVWLRGPLRQRFRVTAIDQAWGADGQDTVTVTAVGYKRLASSRLVQPRYYAGAGKFVQVDQGDIVWGLIEHAQQRPGGDWGVTKGQTTTGIVRDREYVPGDNIGDRLHELQSVINGPWWDIDADLELTASLVTGFPLIDQPLELGVNVRTMQRRSTAAAFANSVAGIGNQDKTSPVFLDAADIATDPRGRWEKMTAWSTVEQQTTLDENTAGQLAETNQPLATWQVEIDANRYITDTTLLPGYFVVVARPPDIAAPIGTPTRRVVCQAAEIGLDLTADGAVTTTASLFETGIAVPA